MDPHDAVMDQWDRLDDLGPTITLADWDALVAAVARLPEDEQAQEWEAVIECAVLHSLADEDMAQARIDLAIAEAPAAP
jgi:hypothetical protein